MIAIDTNVLVRYVVADHAAQVAAVRKFLDNCAHQNEAVFIPSIVLCELAWVLRSVYKQSRQEILEVVEELLNSDPFTLGTSIAFLGAGTAFRTF